MKIHFDTNLKAWKMGNNILIGFFLCFCTPLNALLKSCPYEYNNLAPIKQVTFSQLRTSVDAAVQVRDYFEVSVLSSFFLQRDEFQLELEDGYCTSNEIDLVANSCKSEAGTWLQYLDLSENHIGRVQSSAFSPVAKCLQYVILSNNQLERIDDGAFFGLADLKVLNLSHNQLKDLNTNSTILANSLDMLDLSHNEIKEFTSELPLQNLTFLDLSNNKLKTINFTTASQIKTLLLSHNDIERFEVTNGLQQLEDLNLSNNRLKIINPSILNNLKKLKRLDLSSNTFLLTSQMFNKMTKLETLILNNNKLLTIPEETFKDLENLQRLELTDNGLSDFEFGSFSGLTSLEYLDLSRNNLVNLEFDKLINLENLQTVILNGNALSNLNLQDLNFKLRKLRQIGLGNISWTCPTLARVRVDLRKINISMLELDESSRCLQNPISFRRFFKAGGKSIDNESQYSDHEFSFKRLMSKFEDILYKETKELRNKMKNIYDSFMLVLQGLKDKENGMVIEMKTLPVSDEIMSPVNETVTETVEIQITEAI